jgi:hypothetical protein
VTRHLGDGKCAILRQRVRCSVRAVRAVRNTRVFQTESRVVADDVYVGLAVDTLKFIMTFPCISGIQPEPPVGDQDLHC